MKNMLKLGIVLALYAAAACVGLAFVYEGTKTTIAERAQADLEAALKELAPEADEFPPIAESLPSGDPQITFDSAYAMKQGGRIVGAAVQAKGPSYSGLATVLVGVKADGTISGVKILEIGDTAGLGANAASPSYFVNRARKVTFYGQFAGKALSEPFAVKGDVQAITAATITSRSITAIVKTAGAAAGAWLTANQGASK